jgi:hypothetical protein
MHLLNGWDTPPNSQSRTYTPAFDPAHYPQNNFDLPPNHSAGVPPPILRGPRESGTHVPFRG